MRTGVAAATAAVLVGTAAGTAGPLAAHATATSAAPSSTAGSPTVHSRAVPATSAATTKGGTVAALAPVRTDPFVLLGVTWAPGTAPRDLHVRVRLHTAAGWGGWEHLEDVTGEGPSTFEDADVRAGTAPLWVDTADGVAVRLASAGTRAPADVEVVTVDPGATLGAAAVGERSVAKRRPKSGDKITGSPDFPRLPRVISRRQWGADPSLIDGCFAPRYGSTAKMVFVHHTAGSSRYSVRESPAIVRSILAYHTQGQGWCDIGYNALIDRFGNIYEGRRGGLRKPVRGAHAGDWNLGTAGVSLMGNFQRAEPSRRILNALVRFIGWRLGTSFAPVRGEVRVNRVRFARISGHRDAMSTSCPGDNVYKRLPRIRQRVAHYLTDYSSAAERKVDALAQRRTGAVFVGEQWLRGGTYTRLGKGRIYSKQGLGARWLTGRVLERYQQKGGVSGLLGWPRSDVRRTPVGHARLIGFQHGRMYMPRGHRIRVLHGRVLDRYGWLGYATGRLGLPTSSIKKIRGGQRATFRHGVIRWDRSSDSFTVGHG